MTTTTADVRTSGRPAPLVLGTLGVAATVLVAVLVIAVVDLTGDCSTMLALHPLRLASAGVAIGTVVGSVWLAARSGAGRARALGWSAVALSALASLVAVGLLYVPRICVYDLIP